MAKKLAFLLLGVIVLTLLVAPAAMAFTPQQILKDFVDHGKLTQSYTQAELKAYLRDGTTQAYADQAVIGPLNTLVNSMLRSSFPFTGFQMLLAGIVAVGLVGGGFALRRFSRQA